MPETPRELLTSLRREWAELWRRAEDRQATQVLVASLVLVVVFTIWGRPVFLSVHLPQVARLIGWSPEHAYYDFLPYAYWALTSVGVRVLLPILIIILVIRQRPSDFGFRLRGITPHAWTYLLLFLGMIPIVLAASFTTAFQNKYPLYGGAARDMSHFLLYQIAYGIQFVGVEAFFRGFMTFGLYPRFGYLGIFIMVIPYCMVHFGKPAPEVFMAIPAGLILGYLALKSRTWIFGALLHWTVAITMDALAIIHKGGFGPGAAG